MVHHFCCETYPLNSSPGSSTISVSYLILFLWFPLRDTFSSSLCFGRVLRVTQVTALKLNRRDDYPKTIVGFRRDAQECICPIVSYSTCAKSQKWGHAVALEFTWHFLGYRQVKQLYWFQRIPVQANTMNLLHLHDSVKKTHKQHCSNFNPTSVRITVWVNHAEVSVRAW